MFAPRTACLVVVFALTASVNLFAQQESPISQGDRAGVAVRLVPGILYGHASFGDDDPESTEEFGFNIGGQLWVPMSRSLAFVLQGLWQPTEVENPHEFIDEAFSAFYLLVGLEFGNAPYVRPSVGPVFLSWSGADASEGTELGGFVLGFAVGSELPLGGPFHISPELELRVAPFEAYGVALQVPIGWRPAGQR
jgi:hypothetical protein